MLVYVLFCCMVYIVFCLFVLDSSVVAPLLALMWNQSGWHLPQLTSEEYNGDGHPLEYPCDIFEN